MTLQVYRPSTASTFIRTGPKKRLLLDLLKKMGKEFIIISLDDLRAINVDKITQQLMAVTGFNKVIVNAVDYVDVQVFAIDCYDSGYETREKLYVPHGYSVDEGHWKRTG